MHRTPFLRHLVLPAACLLLAGCGLAESVAESFTGNEHVTLVRRLDRSGAITRTAEGTDLSAQPGFLQAGDTALGHQVLCVLGFAIDGSQQPGGTDLDRIVLRFWVEPRAGVPEDLGRIVVSHLPDHPDAPPSVGQVPHPPGQDVAVVDGPFTAGWREVDVTAAFLQDWNGGRSLSAFAVRFETPSDGDGGDDQVDLEGTDDEGEAALAEVVLTFSVDL